MNSLKYVIINASDVENINFDCVKETGADTLRYNTDGTKTFVKFCGETPECIPEGAIVYDHAGILAILNDPEGDWVSDEEI